MTDQYVPALRQRFLEDMRIKGLQPKINPCGKGEKGLATVSITIKGSNGRVSSAKVVSGGFKGTPQGNCIAKAVKTAKFPKFQKSSFSFSYPFVVK